MASPATTPRASAPGPLLLLGLVTTSWLVLFLARILSPSDLLAYDQQRVASYVMDVTENGHWICQRDFRGEVTSKPPMYTWLAAASTLPFGRIGRFSLCLPSALASLLLAWLVLAVGSRTFGRGAGYWGAIACVLSASGWKQVLLARTDPLFGFTVFLTLVLGWRAWLRGRGWTGTWLSAAVATLTKGPLALVFAGGGILGAHLWERRRGTLAPLRGSHRAGLLLFAGITLGWIGLASWSLGGAVFEKMIGEELVGHAVLPKRGVFPGLGLYAPPLYFLGSFLPWSLAACVGLWRVARRPSEAPETRRGERVLFSFLLVGLAVLALAVHQRRDLVFPLLPAAALLGGKEIAARIHPGRPRVFRALLFGLPACMLAALLVYQIAAVNRSTVVERTRWAKDFARRIEGAVGRSFPLAYVKAPFALPYFLGTYRRNLPVERAAALLEAPESAFVVVREESLDAEEAQRLESAARQEVARWPEGPRPFLRLLGNHPRLEETPSAALVSADLYLRAESLRVVEATERGFVLAPSGGDYAFRVTNEGTEPREVAVEIEGGEKRAIERRRLGPGETWESRGEGGPVPPERPRGRAPGKLGPISAFVAALLVGTVVLAERTRRAVASAAGW